MSRLKRTTVAILVMLPTGVVGPAVAWSRGDAEIRVLLNASEVASVNVHGGGAAANDLREPGPMAGA